MYKPALDKYRSEMQSFLTNPDIFIFVYREEDEPFGILVLMVTDTAAAQIEGIAVSTAHRNKGAGSILLREAIRQMDLGKVCAETDDDAVGFYRRFGFEVNGKLKHYTGGNVMRYSCVWEKDRNNMKA
jgi:Acetyltransferases